MKYCIAGDPHAQPENLYKLQKLFTLIESIGLPTIFLGDLLHNKDIVRAQCLNAYYNYFSTSKLEFTIITGNHDQLTANCTEHSLQTLKALKSVTIIDKPLRRGQLLFVPFQANLEDFRAIISDPGEAEYVFFHQGVNGFEYTNNIIADKEASLEWFKPYKLAIGGHFHKFSTKDNLVYLGSPFSHNFGESNQDKYLGIFDDETGKLELIKTDFPRHITTTLDLGINDNLQVDYYDYNRVILKGTREQIAAFNKSKYPGLKFIEDRQYKVVKLALKETQTPETLFSTWFKDVKKETNNEIFELGLQILKDVK